MEHSRKGSPVIPSHLIPNYPNISQIDKNTAMRRNYFVKICKTFLFILLIGQKLVVLVCLHNPLDCQVSCFDCSIFMLIWWHFPFTYRLFHFIFTILAKSHPFAFNTVPLPLFSWSDSSRFFTSHLHKPICCLHCLSWD